MDTVNELGKELKKTKDRASRALKKASPEYGMAERARDIFDPIVPYTMSFRVPRKGMQIRANMQFEYPPPNGGSGGCCGDCYCAVCERFLVSEITSTSILLNRPYEPGSVSVFNGEVGISVGVSESDPDAGIIYLDACLGSDTVTVCYVYRYGDTNCTNYEEMAPLECFTDTFTRTVSDGWGTSDAGIAWGYLGNYRGTSVANGEGYISVVNNTFATLVASASGYMDMLISARLVNGTTGTFFFAARSTTRDIFEVDFSLGGSVSLWGPDETSTVNVGFGPDEQFFIRIIVTSATSFDAYIWRASETEPTTASLSLVDAGSNFAGLSEVYVGGSGGTFDIYVDKLDIANLNACVELSIFDTFNRTTSNGWGTSDSGYTWSVVDPGTFGVDGTGYVLLPSGQSTLSSQSVSGDGPWSSSNGFVMTARCYVPTNFSTGSDYADEYFFYLYQPSAPNYFAMAKISLSTQQNGGYSLKESGVTSGVSKSDWSAGGWFLIKWERTPSGASRIKVWNDGEAEPETWGVEKTAPATIATMFEIDFASNPNTEVRLGLDYLDFN